MDNIIIKDPYTYKGRLNTYDRLKDKSTMIKIGELPFYGAQEIANNLGKAVGHDIEAVMDGGRVFFKIWKKK